MGPSTEGREGNAEGEGGGVNEDERGSDDQGGSPTHICKSTPKEVT